MGGAGENGINMNLWGQQGEKHPVSKNPEPTVDKERPQAKDNIFDNGRRS